MADPRLFRLRVTYGKTGRLAMLSHLEVARTLERVIRRADLPFAVSQGFSPHMRIAFGSALPVGVGSTCEMYDVFLTDYVRPTLALDRLCGASPADLYPSHCRYVETRDPAVSVAYPFSTYEVRLALPTFDASCTGVDTQQRDVGDDFSVAFGVEVPERIVVKRKKKEKTLVVADYLVSPIDVEPMGNDVCLRFTLESKPTGSLRPDVLMQHCRWHGNDVSEGTWTACDGSAGEDASSGCREAVPQSRLITASAIMSFMRVDQSASLS